MRFLREYLRCVPTNLLILNATSLLLLLLWTGEAIVYGSWGYWVGVAVASVLVGFGLSIGKDWIKIAVMKEEIREIQARTEEIRRLRRDGAE